MAAPRNGPRKGGPQRTPRDGPGGAAPGNGPGMAVRNVTGGTVLAERARAGTSFWALFRGLMLAPSLGPGEGLWLPGVNNIHMLFMRFSISTLFVGRAAG